MKTFLKVFFRVFILLLLAGLIAGAIFLKNFDINSFKETIIAEANKATGGELLINGKMQLKLSLHPYFEINNVVFRNPDLPTVQDLASIKKASVSISILPLLSKTISIREVVLEEPRFYIATNSQGKGNWELPAGSGSGAGASKPTGDKAEASSGFTIDLGKVSGKGIKAIYADGVAGTSYQVDIRSLEIEPSGRNLELSIQAAYSGIPITVKGTVSNVADILSSNTLALDLAALIMDTRIGVSGKTDLDFKDFDFKLAGNGPEITRVPNALGFAIDSMGEFKVDAQAKGSPDSFRVVLNTVSLEKNKVSGDASIVLGTKPQVQFKLHSPLIDITSLQKETKPQANTVQQPENQPQSSSQKLFPDAPLPFEFLDAATVKGVLTIEKFIWGKEDMPAAGSVYASVDLANSKLKLLANSKIGSGSAMADVALEATPNRLAKLGAVLKADIPSVEEFTRSVGTLKGMPVKVNIAAESYGASIAQLMARLNGNVYLEVREGVIEEEMFSWLAGDLLTKAISSIVKKDSNRDIQLKCAAANIDIENGMVDLSRRFAIETDKFNVISGGHLSLANESLAVQVDVAALKGVQVGVSSLLSSLLEVKGTFAAPKVGISSGQALSTAASIGAAVVTGGLSFAGQKVADMSLNDANPCQTAWHRGVNQNPTAAQAATDTVSQTASESVQAVKNTVKDAVNDLKNLFKK